jgi:hypothetical protein
MKKSIKNLKKLRLAQGLTVMELMRRINALQKKIKPEKKPLTRNFYYFALKGFCPNKDNIYLLASVLKTHPQDFCFLEFDDEQYKNYMSTYLSLYS